MPKISLIELLLLLLLLSSRRCSLKFRLFLSYWDIRSVTLSFFRLPLIILIECKHLRRFLILVIRLHRLLLLLLFMLLFLLALINDLFLPALLSAFISLVQVPLEGRSLHVFAFVVSVAKPVRLGLVHVQVASGDAL